MLKLIQEIKACTICKEHLPFDPKPVFSFSKKSKILIVGQAPGIKVQQTGIPWNDASGERLRQWLNIDSEKFYDNELFAIVPMAFCYPGKGSSGDLPPRPECAEQWMGKIRLELKNIKLTILIGQYAHKYFLGSSMKRTLTETVKAWRDYLPTFLVLPHPSPRNNIWLKKNPWFEKELVPYLNDYVYEVLN